MECPFHKGFGGLVDFDFADKFVIIFEVISVSYPVNLVLIIVVDD